MLVDRTGDPAAVERYLRLEESGYKARAGIAMTTVAGEPEFFAEYAAASPPPVTFRCWRSRPENRRWPGWFHFGATMACSCSR